MTTTVHSRLLLVATAFIFCTQVASAQMPPTSYRGPIPPIASGFGADGTFQVDTVRFPVVGWVQQGGTVPRNVEVFYPRGTTTPRPTVLFAHGYGGIEPVYYGELIRHLVSRGYVVVFSVYPVTIDFRALYRTLDTGFVGAVRRFPNIIDSTRIGFMGHSFGAGAMVSLAHTAFTSRAWGKNAKWLYSMAPWYSLELTNDQLRTFPADTKLIMQVYADDRTNDLAMARDVFRSIAIPNAEKDFITVFTDTTDGYTYLAGHQLPNMATPTGGAFDAYDYYATFRLADALIEYAVTGDAAAKNVALGNGSAEQVFMGSLRGRAVKPLAVTDAPTQLPNALSTNFPCDNILNPRRQFCNETTSIQSEQQITIQFPSIFPQPAQDVATLRFVLPSASDVTVRLYNALGQEVLPPFTSEMLSAGVHTIPLSLQGVVSGVYVARVQTSGGMQLVPVFIQH
jgi:acetyl esterase/lipase